MNREEILNMPAGRGLDALVADYLFDLEIVPPKTPTDYDDDIHARPNGSTDQWYYCKPLKHYSTDIAAAMEVVNHERFEYLTENLGRGLDFWEVILGGAVAIAETLSLAICRAALLAVLELEDAAGK